MEPVGFAIGAVASGYAFVQFRRRMLQPDRLPTLLRMKARWGDEAGARLHLVAHIALPALFGLAMWWSAS